MSGLLIGLWLATAGFNEPARAATGTCCYSYTYCSHTCHACYDSLQQDPAFPKTLTSLPLNATYSHEDTNTWNDVCSSGCGTSNCHGPPTSYSENHLPASNGRECSLTPNTQLPTQFNCRFHDGYCSVYCDAYATGSWCGPC